jgi:hypothetical protein
MAKFGFFIFVAWPAGLTLPRPGLVQSKHMKRILIFYLNSRVLNLKMSIQSYYANNPLSLDRYWKNVRRDFSLLRPTVAYVNEWIIDIDNFVKIFANI